MNVDDMINGGFTRALVKRSIETGRSSLPPEVEVVAKQCILDWLGVAIGGSREPLSLYLIDAARAEGCRPQATVVGQNERFSLRQAALINGSMGHALDYDDVNLGAMGHVTAAVLPAVLALAESTHASGAALIRAFVVGYEAAAMVGVMMGPRHYESGFHATGTVGSIGAVMALADLAGLDEDATRRAVGIAATQAGGLKAQFGTMCKPLHAGKAGENALLGVQLAQRGFSSNGEILECRQGFNDVLRGEGNFAAALATPLGKTHVVSNLFKYSAACYGTHSTIEALRRLKSQYQLAVKDIESVELNVHRSLIAMCNIIEPRTGLQAKFSLRFNAALALTGEDTSKLATYSDAMTGRPDLIALQKRVAVIESSDASTQMLVSASVSTSDGRKLVVKHDVGVPETDPNTQWARLNSKFVNLCSPIIGMEASVAMKESVAELNSLGDVADLCGRLR